MQSSAVHVTISHNSVAPGKVSTNFCNFHKQIKRRVFARRFFCVFSVRSNANLANCTNFKTTVKQNTFANTPTGKLTFKNKFYAQKHFKGRSFKKTDKPVVYLNSNQNATSKHHCKSRNSRKWYCANNLLLATYMRFAQNCTNLQIVHSSKLHGICNSKG